MSGMSGDNLSTDVQQLTGNRVQGQLIDVAVRPFPVPGDLEWDVVVPDVVGGRRQRQAVTEVDSERVSQVCGVTRQLERHHRPPARV